MRLSTLGAWTSESFATEVAPALDAVGPGVFRDAPTVSVATESSLPVCGWVATIAVLGKWPLQVALTGLGPLF